MVDTWWKAAASKICKSHLTVSFLTSTRRVEQPSFSPGEYYCQLTWHRWHRWQSNGIVKADKVIPMPNSADGKSKVKADKVMPMPMPNSADGKSKIKAEKVIPIPNSTACKGKVKADKLINANAKQRRWQ